MAAIRKIKDVIVAVCMLIFGLLIAAKLQQQQMTTLTGPFSIVDGDTLHSAGGERLRLAGLDAPEMDQTCRRGDAEWACGIGARDGLRTILDAGGVVCKGEGQDRYQRLLVTCDGRTGDIGAELVRKGLAVAYGDYLSEESEAKAAHRGLWSGTFERPGDFRKRQGLLEEEQGENWLSLVLSWVMERL